MRALRIIGDRNRSERQRSIARRLIHQPHHTLINPNQRRVRRRTVIDMLQDLVAQAGVAASQTITQDFRFHALRADFLWGKCGCLIAHLVSTVMLARDVGWNGVEKSRRLPAVMVEPSHVDPPYLCASQRRNRKFTEKQKNAGSLQTCSQTNRSIDQ